MAENLDVSNLGEFGVNTDLNPIKKPDNSFLKAQNLISDPLGVEKGLKNRPGLEKFNASEADGPVLGGIGVPLQNLYTGSRFFYIGRGPKS